MAICQLLQLKDPSLARETPGGINEYFGELNPKTLASMSIGFDPQRDLPPQLPRFFNRFENPSEEEVSKLLSNSDENKSSGIKRRKKTEYPEERRSIGPSSSHHI